MPHNFVMARTHLKMVIKEKKSRINKRVKTIKIEEYDYKDIVDMECKFTQSSIPYAERVLKKRIKHVDYKVNTHPKSHIIYGMAVQVLFEYAKIVIEELIKGNRVELNKIGTIFLRTRVWSTKFKGYAKDRKRSKEKGIYTGIEVDWQILYNKFRYGEPYFSLGPTFKKRVQKNEDNGIKY